MLKSSMKIWLIGLTLATSLLLSFWCAKQFFHQDGSSPLFKTSVPVDGSSPASVPVDGSSPLFKASVSVDGSSPASESESVSEKVRNRQVHNLYSPSEWISPSYWTYSRDALPSPSIPFYIYTDEVFDDVLYCHIPNFVHRVGMFFLSALENHPWRVFDPEKALLFVVPVLAGAASRQRCQGYVMKHISPSKSLDQVAAYLQTSSYYRRNFGVDHILVDNDWRLHHGTTKKFRNAIQNFTVGVIATFPNHNFRCALPSGYTTPPSSESTQTSTISFALPSYESFSQRHFNLFFQGQTTHKAGYAIRRRVMSSLPGTWTPSVLISTSPNAPYPPCKNNTEGCQEKSDGKIFHDRLQEAKYNIFVYGDDLVSSARLFDAFLYGSINLIFSDEIWTRGLPSQCQVDWERIAIRGNSSELFLHPEEEMQRVRDMLTPERIQSVLSNLSDFLPHVLWEIPTSLLATDHLYNAARKCVPTSLLEMNSIHPSDFHCDFNDPSVSWLSKPSYTDDAKKFCEGWTKESKRLSQEERDRQCEQLMTH